jgi:hypothetical protein
LGSVDIGLLVNEMRRTTSTFYCPCLHNLPERLDYISTVPHEMGRGQAQITNVDLTPSCGLDLATTAEADASSRR